MRHGSHEKRVKHHNATHRHSTGSIVSRDDPEYSGHEALLDDARNKGHMQYIEELDQLLEERNVRFGRMRQSVRRCHMLYHFEDVAMNSMYADGRGRTCLLIHRRFAATTADRHRLTVWIFDPDREEESATDLRGTRQRNRTYFGGMRTAHRRTWRTWHGDKRCGA